MKFLKSILVVFAVFIIVEGVFSDDFEMEYPLDDSDYEELEAKKEAVDPDDDHNDNKLHHLHMKQWWRERAKEIYAGIYGDDARMPASFLDKSNDAFDEVMEKHKEEHHGPKKPVVVEPKPTPKPKADEKLAKDNDHFHQQMHDWWKEQTHNIHKLVYGDKRMPLKYRAVADRYFRQAMRQHLHQHHMGDHVPFTATLPQSGDGYITLPPAQAQIDTHQGQHGADWDPFAPPKRDTIMNHLPPWMNGTATSSDSDDSGSEPDDDAWGTMARMPHWMLGKRSGPEGRQWKYPMPKWLTNQLSGKKNYRHNLPKWMEYYSKRSKRHCYYRHGRKRCDSKYYRKYRPGRGYQGRPHGMPRRYRHRYWARRKSDRKTRCVKIKGHTYCTGTKKAPTKSKKGKKDKKRRKRKTKTKTKYKINRTAKRVSELRAWLRRYRRHYHGVRRSIRRYRKLPRRDQRRYRNRRRYRRHTHFKRLYESKRRELARITPRRRYRLSYHRRKHAHLHAWLKKYARYYHHCRRGLRKIAKKYPRRSRKYQRKYKRYTKFIRKYHKRMRALRNYHRRLYGYYPRLSYHRRHRYRYRRRPSRRSKKASEKKGKKKAGKVVKKTTITITKKKEGKPVVVDLTKTKKKAPKKDPKQRKVVVVDMTGKKEKKPKPAKEPIVIVAQPKASTSEETPSNAKCEMADSTGFCTFSKLCKKGIVGPSGQGGCRSGERCCVYKQAEKEEPTPEAPKAPAAPAVPHVDRKKCMSACFRKFPPFGLKDDAFEDDPMILDAPSSTSTTSESDSDDAPVAPKGVSSVKVSCVNKCALKIAQLREKMAKQGGGAPSEETVKRVKEMCLKMDKCEKKDEKKEEKKEEKDEDMIRDVDVATLPENLKTCIVAC